MGERIEGQPPELVGRVVALTERRPAVSHLMRHQGEEEHRKGEQQVTEQEAILGEKRA